MELMHQPQAKETLRKASTSQRMLCRRQLPHTYDVAILANLLERQSMRARRPAGAAHCRPRHRAEYPREHCRMLRVTRHVHPSKDMGRVV